MKKNAVLLTSHGHFAKYALDSAQMIVGAQENCDYLSVTVDTTLKEASLLMKEKAEQLDLSAGLVIIADLFGGTPANISSELLLSKENVLVICGLNLPMLIELFLHQDKPLSELATLLESAYRQGYNNINQTLLESEEDCNECQDL